MRRRATAWLARVEACSSSLCPANRWRPRLLGPGDADARDLRVDEIRLALRRGLARPLQCRAEFRGRLRDFGLDAEALRDVGHVHVGLAEIVVEEMPGLDHATAGHLLDHAAVRPA